MSRSRSKLRLPGANWSPIATVRTGRSGRFTFKALPGPSRLLRFRYGARRRFAARPRSSNCACMAASSFRATGGTWSTVRSHVRRPRKERADPAHRQAAATAGLFARPVADICDAAWQREGTLAASVSLHRDAWESRSTGSGSGCRARAATRTSLVPHARSASRFWLVTETSARMHVARAVERYRGVQSDVGSITATATYGNVMATIALFVAVGGTSYAAITLPRNSVGQRQLQAGAVAGAERR